MLQHICCYTSRIWFPCNVLWKLVAESGCKQIQSWLVMCITISWKTEISSFHSELCLAFRDSHSACTFRVQGRYSGERRKFQMNFLMCKSSQLNVPRICKWIAIFDCYLLNVRIANFATTSFRTFMCRPCYLSTNFSKVDIFLQKAPQNDADASICITKFGPFYLVIFHCLVLNFTPIKDVPVLADSLIVIFLLLL